MNKGAASVPNLQHHPQLRNEPPKPEFGSDAEDVPGWNKLGQ